ncbi:MAG: purine-nucleoside phosphorylase [Desulfobacterales bacterium]|jgi:purine-nucleoside phosphorylase|nr:purine-nucleoside phosphorylase [Desulfobacterales bacterium]
MDSFKNRAAETVEFLRRRIRLSPRTGLLTGTGLGEASEALQVSTAFEYKDIPHFPASTVPGHAGRLLFGHVAGRPVMVMQGRFHLYEGYSPGEVVFPIRVMRELGARRVLVTNAAGGLHPAHAPGDLMLITDHINLTGENPLVGGNEEDWGPRFPDMTCAYDRGLIGLAKDAARAAGIPLRTGVYAGLKGPSLETPAETRLLKTIGAEAVGFSTVQEVIAAVHGGLKVLGISVITNVNDPDRPVPATVDEIIAVARRAAPDLARLLTGVMRQIDDGDSG